jgi:SNF family Na+-dependent transporter
MTSAVLLSTESQPGRNVLCEGQTTYEYTKQTKDSQTKACLHRIKLWRSTALVLNLYFVVLTWISRYPTSLNMAEWISSASTLQGFAAQGSFSPSSTRASEVNKYEDG